MSVVWARPALKDLRGLAPHVARRVFDAASRFDETGQGDVVKLHGYNPASYRLRVGDWRVIFEREEDQRMLILRVLHRRDAYR